MDIVHADIFFFISSIGFIILFLVLIVAACYLISFLRSVRRITDKLEATVDTIEEDTKEFLEDLRGSTMFRLLFGVKKRKIARHSTKSE